MSEESAIPYLNEVLVFLAAAVLIVPLFHRLKVSPILGYLAVGVMLGPFGLGLVADVEGVTRLAELGVVFLLFTIGLELSLERLWAMRRLVFGLGTTQIVVTAGAVAGLALAWGNPAPVAVVLGAVFALSSTAMVMQLLVERGEIATRHGRTAFSVLLMQDLAVVPLLFLVTLLAQPDGAGGIGPALLMALLRGALAIAVIILVGRLVVRPLFGLVAGTRSSELFLAVSLLAILGLAWATDRVGLSTAFGAFLAGLLIAETEFRPQVEADIRPFRGLLLGLFFIAVGMSIDLGTALADALWVVLSVIGLVLLKAAIAAFLALLFGRPLREAVRSGILLGQAGEFGFIILGSAVQGGLMTTELGQFMAVVVGLSMAVTPFLPRLADFATARLPVPDEGENLPLPDGEMAQHVVIAGFGRVGQMVARLLRAQKVPYLVLETDPDLVRRMRQRDEPVYFGNPAQSHVLERVGGDKALAIVIAVNDGRATAHMVREIRSRWPGIPVYTRARDIPAARELSRRGATAAVPETEESSLQLGARILTAIGIPADAVNTCVEEARSGIEAETRAPPGDSG